MTITRKSVEFAKQIFADRLGDRYIYGGNWDPADVHTGTDCSGLVGDCLDACNEGTAMPWQRSVSTESWPYDYASGRPAAPGTRGPKGTIAVASLADVPADAAVVVNIHHGGGGADSHTQCIVDGVVMESNGSHGTCTLPGGAIDPNSSYWTDHWYLPGPIIEDGTPRTAMPTEPQNTFFADVSEFQTGVDDSYPYPVLSIRVSDGTYRDHKFAQNYAWMRQALDSGKLTFGIVYTYVRPNWQGNASTVRAMIDGAGGLHPRVALMLDVEEGGNPAGDGSAWINALYDDLAAYAGNPARIIGYANRGDFTGLWRTRPPGLRVIGAGYGSNPNLPGQIAHQYTDGSAGANQGLPMSCAPFGHCDMNVADNLSPEQFAAACGIGTAPATPTGGISMADAQSLKDEFDGVANGKPLPWRNVHMLREATVGDLSTQTDGDQEAPNESPSVFDQVATLAKILTRRHNGKDIWDMVCEIHDAVVK